MTGLFSRPWLAGAGALLILCGPTASATQAEFSTCRFHFGMFWQGNDATYPAELDHVAVWAGSDEDFNIYWHGAMLEATQPNGMLAGATPVFYSYIIAFTARRDAGLQDCDVGSPNLCEGGANFIRTQRARILQQYNKYAAGAAAILGTNSTMIWLMEPDYFQYAADTQQGGGLSYAELGALMSELVGAIRTHLPHARISMDISPWVPDQASWFAAFDLDLFDFLNTSGGRTEADSPNIRNVNPATWSQLHILTGKPILADDGYGVGGGSIGHDDSWDVPAHLNARIADGVIGITQANPRPDWNSILVQLRPQLQPLAGCGAAATAGGSTGSGSTGASSSAGATSGSTSGGASGGTSSGTASTGSGGAGTTGGAAGSSGVGTTSGSGGLGTGTGGVGCPSWPLQPGWKMILRKPSPSRPVRLKNGAIRKIVGFFETADSSRLPPRTEVNQWIEIAVSSTNAGCGPADWLRPARTTRIGRKGRARFTAVNVASPATDSVEIWLRAMTNGASSETSRVRVALAP